MEVLTTKGYVYQSFVETKENNSPLFGLDEAIDNALDAIESETGKVEINYFPNEHKISIRDNGNGMPYSLVSQILSNAVYHKGNDNSIGIKGVGIKKMAALLSNLIDSTLIIYTSDGGEQAVVGKLRITNDDEIITHPKIGHVKNNFAPNTINVNESHRLKGTTIVVIGCENLKFDYFVLRDYSVKYSKSILKDKKRIYFNVPNFNDYELKPIDPTYTLNVEFDKSRIYTNNNLRMYAIDYLLKIFHKDEPYKEYDLKVRGIQICDPSRLREKYPIENTYRFNDLSGIFAYRGGRLINQVGNVREMFGMVNSQLTTTKGNGIYGDISGSLSGYNRIVLYLDDDNLAKIFNVPSIKSKGIQSLYLNNNLFDYKCKINGKEIFLYEAICYIRKFNHMFYQDCLKGTTDWDSFDNNIINYYNNFDFSKGVKCKEIKRVTKTNIETSKIIHKRIISTNNYLNIKYGVNSSNKVASIDSFNTNISDYGNETVEILMNLCNDTYKNSLEILVSTNKITEKDFIKYVESSSEYLKNKHQYFISK